MDDRPEDQRRTIADIISWIANFTHKIKWIFTKDLKPRVLFGLKSDGTVVFINDADGYPETIRKPELMVNEIAAFTWTGTAGSKQGTTVTAKGYRQIIVLTVQPTWVSAPSGALTMQPNYSHDGIIWFSDDNDEALITLTIGNDRTTFSVIYFSPDPMIGTAGFPIGELAAYFRLQITATGGTPEGLMITKIYGVR